MITFLKLGQYGRLGNIQFQAAATIAHAIKNNDDYIFPHHPYEKDLSIPLNKYSDNIFTSWTFEETTFHYSGIPFRPNMNLHGYFQSYKYWKDQKEVVNLVKPKISFPFKEKTASLHIRRTDYLSLIGCYQNLDLTYYQNAMDLVKAEKYLIFSDDINWCKQVFKGPEFEFIEGNSATIDQAIMSSCQDNIIANSSFSWWAAYFNTFKDKKVIAPKLWFGPKLAPTHDTKDLIPQEWIKL